MFSRLACVPVLAVAVASLAGLACGAVQEEPGGPTDSEPSPTSTAGAAADDRDASGSPSLAGGAGSLRAGPNLVLVSIDTLRADRLPAYGYDRIETPALDRLVAEGVRFGRVTSPVPLTLPAHSSLLTGQYPFRHGVRDNGTFRLDEEAVTLAEVLGREGYVTAGFVAAYVLDRRYGVAQGFDRYTSFDEPEIAAGVALMSSVERDGAEVVREASEWLAARSRPFFAWVHLYEPHFPWEPPEPHASRHAGRPYDGEVAYADELVGRLMESLRAAGHADDTLVVVTADHGEGLGDHDERYHGFLVYESTLRVPLVLWAPGRLPGGVLVEGQASLVDVLPTVLALLGVEDEPGIERDGIDLRGLVAAPTAPGRPVYSESMLPMLHFGWGELRAWRDGDWKLIEAPRPELYDLAADAGEARNLLADEPERVAALRTALRETVAGDNPGGIAAEQAPVDAEAMARLRALGYVGGGGQPADRRDVDPKDKVEAFEAFSAGIDEVAGLAAGERWAEAERILRRLEETVPDHYLVDHYLGRSELAQGRPAEAIARLERSLELNGSFSQTHVQLAEAYLRAGRVERAVELLRESMRAFPEDPSLPLQLAKVYYLSGRPGDALEAALAAVRLAPRRPELLNNVANLYLETGQPGEAARALETLLEERPDDGRAWGTLGAAYAQDGRTEAALAAFRRAAELLPDSAQARFNVGLLLARMGRTEEAVDALRETLRLDPGHPGARTLLEQLGNSPR